MTLTILRKKDTTPTLINYRVPLWDRCVPGLQEPFFVGPAKNTGLMVKGCGNGVRAQNFKGGWSTRSPEVLGPH